RRRRGVLSDDRQPGGTGTGVEHRHRPTSQFHRHPSGLVHLGGRRATVVDLAVRRTGHVRGDVALRPRLGRSRLRSRRLALADDAVVIIPILAPGLVAVALFGFTLSYDE